MEYRVNGGGALRCVCGRRHPEARCIKLRSRKSAPAHPRARIYTLMQRCAHGSAPVGALPWAQHALCASDWLNFVLICNIADGLLDYAEVIAYLATHSQTSTYQSPQNRWHSSSHPPPAQASYRLPCWIVALRHYVTWLSSRVRRFSVIQEYLERSRGRRRCIKESATTGALLNATRLRGALH